MGVAGTVFSKIGSFFKWVARQFIAFAEWMQDTFFDIEVSRQIRADLGLDPEGHPVATLPTEAMAGIKGYVAANNPDKAAFAILIADIAEVVEALLELIETVNTNPSENRSNQEIFYQFMRIWALQHVRTRVPLVYSIGKLSGAVQDQFGVVEDLDVDKLVGLFLDTTEDEEDAPVFHAEEANRYSNLISFTSLATQLILAEFDIQTGWINTYYGWDPDPSRTPPPPPLQADEAVLQRAWTFIIGDPDSAAGLKLLVTFILVPTEDGGPGLVISLGGELDLVAEKRYVELDPETDEVIDDRTTVYTATSTTGNALSFFVPLTSNARDFDVSVGDPAQAFNFSAEPKPLPAELQESFPPALRIGHRDGTRLDVGSTGFGFDAGLDRLGVYARFKDAELVIELSDGDSFLGRLPGDDIRLRFDLNVLWDNVNHLRLEGGAGLRTTLPISKSLLWDAITIHFIKIALIPSPEPDRQLRLEVSTALSFDIGPITAVVEEFGFHLDARIGDGNLGFADVVEGYKPPKGVGLAIRASVIRGGGYLFFDHAKNEYSGALELKLWSVTIKAIGILTTKVPEDPESWALLIGLYGEFRVQLGFNFTLLGVGGILGLQHGLSLDKLQAGVRTGILDSVLFPVDPVGNAPRLINQLRTVFPIRLRALTVGPFLRLGYSTPSLIELTLGVLVQFDNALNADDKETELTRLSVVGRLAIEVPPKEGRPASKPAVLVLKLDFAGSYDFPTDFLAIDAALRDSHISGMALAGTFVLRALGGDDPSFICAAGGFNPRFKDLPANLPKQERLSIKFKRGIADIRIELYVAKTSNTWQAGVGAFLKAKKWGFTVEAWLTVDTLFEEEPIFFFYLDVKIGGTLKKGSTTLMELDVKLALRGPGYWIADGSAKFKILFFSKTLKFHEEWGDEQAEQFEEIEVGTLVQAALAKPESWSAQLPRGGEQLVTFRSVEAEGTVLAHPMGDVVARQTVVPLKLRLDRVGPARPASERTFDITEVTVGGDSVSRNYVRDHFARASFLDLSHEEKLAAESFEKFASGVRFGSDAFTIPADRVSAPTEYEVKYRGRPTAPHVTGVRPELLQAQIAWGAAAQARFGLGVFAGRVVAPVRLNEPPLAVATTKAMATVEIVTDPLRSYSILRQEVTARGQQVVEAHELEDST
jgi:hypothetical protein